MMFFSAFFPLIKQSGGQGPWTSETVRDSEGKGLVIRNTFTLFFHHQTIFKCFAHTLSDFVIPMSIGIKSNGIYQ